MTRPGIVCIRNGAIAQQLLACRVLISADCSDVVIGFVASGSTRIFGGGRRHHVRVFQTRQDGLFQHGFLQLRHGLRATAAHVFEQVLGQRIAHVPSHFHELLVRLLVSALRELFHGRILELLQDGSVHSSDFRLPEVIGERSRARTRVCKVALALALARVRTLLPATRPRAIAERARARPTRSELSLLELCSSREHRLPHGLFARTLHLADLLQGRGRGGRAKRATGGECGSIRLDERRRARPRADSAAQSLGLFDQEGGLGRRPRRGWRARPRPPGGDAPRSFWHARRGRVRRLHGSRCTRAPIELVLVLALLVGARARNRQRDALTLALLGLVLGRALDARELDGIPHRVAKGTPGCLAAARRGLDLQKALGADALPAARGSVERRVVEHADGALVQALARAVAACTLALAVLLLGFLARVARRELPREDQIA
mmetsp:Transcript_4131/g.16584  ORF Transcript_4131/g.16584 Transcript_4131/m.16584 type:complete len:436 (-) Transcript_4131:202-1509(-)